MFYYVTGGSTIACNDAMVEFEQLWNSLMIFWWLCLYIHVVFTYCVYFMVIILNRLCGFTNISCVGCMGECVTTLWLWGHYVYGIGSHTIRYAITYWIQTHCLSLWCIVKDMRAYYGCNLSMKIVTIVISLT